MTLRKKCFLLSLSLVLLIFIGGCGEEGSLGEVLTFPSTRQEETVLFDEFLDAAFANLASQDTRPSTLPCAIPPLPASPKGRRLRGSFRRRNREKPAGYGVPADAAGILLPRPG